MGVRVLRPRCAGTAAWVCACVLIASGAAEAAPAAKRRAPAPPRAWDESHVGLPRVGSAAVFVPHTQTPHVILMVSDVAGWNKAMIQTARRVAAQAIVVGISYPALKRAAQRETGCWYVASDFEMISH